MILYVDDEARRTQSYLDEMRLELTKHEIVYKNRVDEALKVFRENIEKVELLILDIMMPPGISFKADDTMQGLRTGVRMYQLVREINPSLLVIIFTNVSDPEVKEYFAKESGCVFLRKEDYMPFEFVEAVKEILREF